MNEKIALGTVQFGLDYGISNTKGKVSAVEVSEILQVARQAGIVTIDTARAYGESEETLGRSDLEPFRIVTKLSPGTTSLASARASLAKSKKSLGQQAVIDAVLLHDFSDYGDDKLSWNSFLELQKELSIGKIGFSLYQPDDWWSFRKVNVLPQIIQVPYNWLDRRFERVMADAKSCGTEVHIRSIFLQGLFFKNPDGLPVHFARATATIEEAQFAFDGQVDKIAGALLNFARCHQHVDRCIIGVTSSEQLSENLTNSSPDVNESNWFSKNTPPSLPMSILNPALWP